MIRETMTAIGDMLGLSPNDDAKPARTDSLAAISSVWQNAQTGLGLGGSDRVTAHVPAHLSCLTPYELEVLYLGDGIARKIVAKVVEEAFKNGTIISYNGDDERSRDLLASVVDHCEAIGLDAKAKKAAELGRAYGMGALLVGANGGESLSDEPLDPTAVRSVDHLTVLDRRDLSVSGWRPPRQNTRFSEHEYYIPAVDRQLYGLDLQRIHASHLVAFGGLDTAIRDRRRYWTGYDEPVLQPVWDVLRRFDSAHQSIDAMLQDGSQGVMMVRDLWKVVTQAGGLDKLETRMQLTALYRAAHKWLILDAGGADGSPAEDFKWVQRTFAGLSDLTQDKQALVAAVADMPITQLFGRSPAGENATGEHDAMNWQASVNSWFRQSAKQQMESIVGMVATSMGAQDPGGFVVSIPPLQQMSALKQAELEERQAKTDDMRIAQGFPEETILRHRYGMGEYRSEPPMLTEEDLEAVESASAPFNPVEGS